MFFYSKTYVFYFLLRKRMLCNAVLHCGGENFLQCIYILYKNIVVILQNKMWTDLN